MIAGGNTRHLKLHDSFQVLKSNTYLCTSAFVHTPQCFQNKKRRRDTSFSTKSFNNAENQNSLSAINNIAIVGGGLAGLSTAYHLLELSQLSNMPLRITIYDKSMVGEGGASAVAGGLQHPFSPRGKMIHFGMEALKQSQLMVDEAIKYQPSCLIRPHLYRIALTETNVKQLQETASQYPELATWLSQEQVNTQLGADSLGGIKLSNGCQVIHVPLYLNALWEACELKAKGRITWKQMQINDQSTQLFRKHHDTVIYAAGAGIVQNEMLHSKDDLCLPVQLIRGQSIIMSTPKENEYISSEALLCGKYISPMPISVQSEAKERSFVIGATHEFKSTKLDEAEVVNELKQRCYQLSPYLWETGVVKKFTSGVRMQSNRGKYGRMPIVGRLDNSSWIFTGLSSRGLIYHGLFGRWLAEAVLQDNEQTLSEYFEEFDWWKQKKDRSELKS